MRSLVEVVKCNDYSIDSLLSAIPDRLFDDIVSGNNVVIKPNWVLESHRSRVNEWEYVITHPSVITAVLSKVLSKLSGSGRVSIIDGPMTEASFEKLIDHYPVLDWKHLAAQNGIALEIIDLRDHEWVMKNDVIVERKTLSGDPRGKVLFDLTNDRSEFCGHKKSKRGYYGADYDREETNSSHTGENNKYSVSRTVIECDVFINMPKLKTHRTAGITCCLKNLVGINTYKNFLPHYSEGGPSEDGDQFPLDNLSTRIEGPLVSLLKQNILKNPFFARRLSHLNTFGKKVFGNSNKVVRNGSWYGNDTLWRMILDLNKLLFYGNSDGTLRSENIVQTKRYIGIVDAILAGEGEGPLSPDPVTFGKIIYGTSPVAIDAVCSVLMGFDAYKIPTIAKAFEVRRFPLCNFLMADIQVFIDGTKYSLFNISPREIVAFKAQHGWKGHIESTPETTQYNS